MSKIDLPCSQTRKVARRDGSRRLRPLLSRRSSIVPSSPGSPCTICCGFPRRVTQLRRPDVPEGICQAESSQSSWPRFFFVEPSRWTSFTPFCGSISGSLFADRIPLILCPCIFPLVSLSGRVSCTNADLRLSVTASHVVVVSTPWFFSSVLVVCELLYKVDVYNIYACGSQVVLASAWGHEVQSINVRRNFLWSLSTSGLFGATAGGGLGLGEVVSKWRDKELNWTID